ncbi:MAG: hypothetical protein NZ955_02985 [Candidatus Bathyarchaeota archaeon]|nr:hypothetical protein [Candidatus Bathyarchaeota archaeon]
MIYTMLDEGIPIYVSLEEAEKYLYKGYVKLLDLTSIDYRCV